MQASSHCVSCFNCHIDAPICLHSVTVKFQILICTTTVCLSVCHPDVQDMPRFLWHLLSLPLTPLVSSFTHTLVNTIAIQEDRKSKNLNILIWCIQESTSPTGQKILLLKPEQFFLCHYVDLNITLKNYLILFYVCEYLHTCGLCTTCLHGNCAELCLPFEISLAWEYISFITLNPILCILHRTHLSLAGVYLCEQNTTPKNLVKSDIKPGMNEHVRVYRDERKNSSWP